MPIQDADHYPRAFAAKDGFFRLALGAPELSTGKPFQNASRQQAVYREAEELEADLVAFPLLSLTGACLGNGQVWKAEEALLAAEKLARVTQGRRALLISSLPLLTDLGLLSVLAIMGDGRIQAFQPLIPGNQPPYRLFCQFPDGASAQILLSDGSSVPLLSPKTRYSLEGSPLFDMSFCTRESLFSAPDTSLQLIFSSDRAQPREKRELESLLAALSAEKKQGLLALSSSKEEAPAAGACSGYRLAAEAGEILFSSPLFSDERLYVSDFDLDYLKKERAIQKALKGREASAERTADTLEAPHFALKRKIAEKRAITRGSMTRQAAEESSAPNLLRSFSPYPFLPEKEEEESVSEEMLNILSEACARRFHHVRSEKMILGLSGGLDSCLALLIALRSLKKLGRPSEDLLCVSMPGPGSSARTRQNAKILAEEAGASFREIPIDAALQQHLRDLGHDGKTKDVSFENAQARERTQILMDLANMENGLVLGTGDLSELALGWCTYNGDQMSMYALNASVPKTLVRLLCAHEAERLRAENEAFAACVLDVLATPVSPELLPPTEGRGQWTEDILGPYELHDFFLWHLLARHAEADKIYRLAVAVFSGRFEEALIRKTLETFLKRFATQQFKRANLPEGADLGLISLAPGSGFVLPAELSSDFLKFIHTEDKKGLQEL